MLETQKIAIEDSNAIWQNLSISRNWTLTFNQKNYGAITPLSNPDKFLAGHPVLPHYVKDERIDWKTIGLFDTVKEAMTNLFQANNPENGGIHMGQTE